MRFCTTIVAIICGFFMMVPAVHAAPPTQLPPARHAELKANAALIRKARTPGYAVLFKGKGYEGGAVVATVTSSSFKSWMSKVGKQSIGFHDDGSPDAPGGTGALRIGDQYYAYNDVRDDGYPEKMEPYQSGTEVTFLVSDSELAAFKAFYRARSLKLIKDTRGNPMDPKFTDHGASNTRQEGCTGACTSGLNPLWVQAFKRNIPALRQYGQENGHPELAAISDDAAEVLLGFVNRTGTKQQTSSKVMVRSNFARSSMITVFDSHRYGRRSPIKWLTWENRRDYGSWNGLGTPAVIPDAPNDKPKATVQTERIPLAKFVQP
jgi:hypothetical protein